MSLFDAVVLGLIQGIAEFLPISSKGHLFLAQHFLGLEDPERNLFFVVMLHQASLAAIVAYYGRAMLRTVASARREILWVVLGTVPAALAGKLLKPHLLRLYVEPTWTFLGFLGTAAVLFAATRLPRGERRVAQMTAGEAFRVGVFQAAALLPGVSRSGMTVSAGLFGRLAAGEAVRFSFYLGAVAILGAGVLELGTARAAGLTVPIPVLAVGLAVTFGASLASLWAVERLVDRGSLWIFSAYCALTGSGGLLWLALR